MTFQQLQYLLEVHRAGSITQAAKKLFVSTSSVSIAVGNLEAELGYPIFIRNQKGLVPTDNGRQVIEYAGRICTTYERLNNINAKPKRTIILGGTDYPPVNRAFARVVEENRERHKLTFSTVSHVRDEVINQIAYQEMDLSVSANFAPRVRILEAKLEKKNLQWKFLKTVPAAIRVGPGHRFYDAESVAPRDLESEVLLDNAKRVYLQSDYLRGLVRFDPERAIITNKESLRHELISRGLAYTIELMPPKDFTPYPSIRYVPIENVNYLLVLITNPAHRLPPEAERFLTLLDEELEKA